MSAMSASHLETKRLRLVPHAPKHMLALIQGPDSYERSFGLIHIDTGTVIGFGGFKGPPGADSTVEIAYGVVPDYEGKGFATEAAQALVNHAFSSALVRIVRAHPLPEPNASTRVLAKCGFRHMGAVTDPEDGLVWRWEKENETDKSI